MTSRLVRLVPLVVLGALLTACAPRTPELAPTAGSTSIAWSGVFAQATREVQEGRHAAADRLLLDFQQTHPAAPEAADAAYYRALFRLDPSNSAMSTRDAVMLLDALLATPIVNTPLSPRTGDAVVLRRIANSIDTRPITVVTTPAAGSGTSSSSAARAEESKAKDEEITRLKDELSKANAELERIKRRVATPKP